MTRCRTCTNPVIPFGRSWVHDTEDKSVICPNLKGIAVPALNGWVFVGGLWRCFVCRKAWVPNTTCLCTCTPPEVPA